MTEIRELPESDILPLLPVRDVVIFPHMILPLFVGREKSIAAINEALATDRLIFLATQKEMIESPEVEDIFSIGTLAQIMRTLKLPDGRLKVMVQGVQKGKIVDFVSRDPFFKVRIETVFDTEPGDLTLEGEALIKLAKDQVKELISLGKNLPNEINSIIQHVREPSNFADLVAGNMDFELEDVQELLETLDPYARLSRLNVLLGQEIEILTVQNRIQNQAREEMNKSQKEFFLREQMRAIQTELGEGDIKNEDMEDFRQRLEEAKMPDKTYQEAEKQLRRLEMMHSEAAEYSMLHSYLDWLVSLPWSHSTRDNLDIIKAARILDEDHYDLEKVKERILEFLAVRKLTKKLRGPVLCFVGPPGVGKTSLGKSIARALGRKFTRISLGGIRDEAEIRGHRRTYVGALPGRIMQGIKQAGTNNPVFMLDELDKVGADFRGDPSAALLELLDPEQNHAFSDHYINLPFDLSKVMFIVTANIIDPIPSALKDRLEIIRLSGYNADEKLAICKRYLLPRQTDANGLKKDSLHFSDKAILKVISEYTSEAGLRNLEREIGSICRKVARIIAEGKKQPLSISENSVEKFLGPAKFLPEEERRENEIGVCTGLAWTETGGDVLYVEVSVMAGKGQLNLTGHLGDVMKESAQAALSFARAHAKELEIDPSLFAQQDVHVHVPAGAIPKDGPSAGITITTAIISALTGRGIKTGVAMTGEVTLRGKILAVGGLKEKILAAVRADIKTIVIPRANKKDLVEIPPNLLRKVDIIPVQNMTEVLQATLEDKP
ncbi:MAG: endopeptidase La [Deltaproteobacteria bacterium]|nr:endopeptidase La [Deltaproteobacteria bacterium]